MSISSVSRTFDAQDPILTTDLDLMAKVDTYKESRFEAGAQAVQQEINNWAMMANIAKPELKSYANQKLNNIVNGINNLGGIDTSDINNVNQLKSMSYNIYGDKRIMDGVATTQNLRTFMANRQAKLSGKDADKYDNTVGDYLMKGYNDWMNDGDVDNSRYDGPTDLPMGNMNTINTKVTDYLKKLTPDSDSAPSGDLQKSFGYFQVDGKWLKGNRIAEAIDAVTDENDSLIFRAHGWGSLRGSSDQNLVSGINLIYDNTASDIKSEINTLQAELNQTSDAGRKLALEKEIGNRKTALGNNDREKSAWANKKELSPQEREGIQESLYKNAWKSNIVNSYSFNQQKNELKSNMPLIFQERMNQQAYQWGKDYDLRVAQYELGAQKQQWEMTKDNMASIVGGNQYGQYGLPKTLTPNTDENNQDKNPAAFIDGINSDYFKTNAAYSQSLYEIMGEKDTSGRFYKNSEGLWKPKPEYKDQVETEVTMLNSKLDNYYSLTDAEKAQLNLPTNAEELQSLLDQRQNINTLRTFKQMGDQKENEIVRNAIATGQVEGDWRNTEIRIGGKSLTVNEALGQLSSGVLNDESQIEGIGLIPGSTKTISQFSDLHSMKDLKKAVNEVREDAQKSYEKVGGKIFNSYTVPIPMASLKKEAQDIIRRQLAGVEGVGGDVDQINPINGEIQYNFKTGQPVYKLKVQMGTGKKQVNEEIDVSQLVRDSPNSGIGSFFDKSDFKYIWGMKLSNDGKTPFAKNDNYSTSLRTNAKSGNYPFQIVEANNSLNGTQGYKVKLALPVGEGKTVEVDVKNFQSGSTLFPASYEAIKNYLDQILSTPELKNEFYKAHGLELNK